MASKTIELHDVNVPEFNLRSKLCQLVGLTQLIEGGKIAEAFVECDDPEDESKLFRFNLFGKK